MRSEWETLIYDEPWATDRGPTLEEVLESAVAPFIFEAVVNALDEDWLRRNEP